MFYVFCVCGGGGGGSSGWWCVQGVVRWLGVVFNLLGVYSVLPLRFEEPGCQGSAVLDAELDCGK